MAGPFPASATPQMAGQRLARREPSERAMTALQHWPMEPTIACVLRLVLTLSEGL